jgi:hypothetical protein
LPGLFFGFLVVGEAVRQRHGIAVLHHGQADHFGTDLADSDDQLAAAVSRRFLAPRRTLDRRSLELDGLLQEQGRLHATLPQLPVMFAVLTELGRIDAVQLNGMAVDLQRVAIDHLHARARHRIPSLRCQRHRVKRRRGAPQRQEEQRSDDGIGDVQGIPHVVTIFLV